MVFRADQRPADILAKLALDPRTLGDNMHICRPNWGRGQ